MSHRKNKQSTQGHRQKGGQVKEYVARRERIPIEDWQRFERWQQHADNLGDAIGEATDCFKEHCKYLTELSLAGEDVDELLSCMNRMSRIFYAIETGQKRKNKKKEYYEQPPQQPKNGKMKLVVCEVIIDDISDGKL